MTALVPPNLNTLRAFVRGELAPADAQAVNRWCGRCVDPDLVDVLDGLTLEWHEAQADALLPAAWARELGAKFLELWAAGAATFGAEVLDLSLLTLRGVPALPTGVSLHRVSPKLVRVVAVAPADATAAIVLASADRGDFEVLARARQGASTWPALEPVDWTVDQAEGRVTFWLVSARGSEATAAMDAWSGPPNGDSLVACLHVAGVAINAVRLPAVWETSIEQVGRPG